MNTLERKQVKQLLLKKKKMKSKKEIRIKKRYSIRKKISGTAEKPRLAVFRSNKEIYVQLIDDLKGHTLSSASSRDEELNSSKSTKIEQAMLVGKLIAENAKKIGVSSVVFDRGGFIYHGRIKALADAAREGGLKF
jgi:large subunit ribosomal protein L18